MASATQSHRKKKVQQLRIIQKQYLAKYVSKKAVEAEVLKGFNAFFEASKSPLKIPFSHTSSFQFLFHSLVVAVSCFPHYTHLKNFHPPQACLSAQVFSFFFLFFSFVLSFVFCPDSYISKEESRTDLTNDTLFVNTSLKGEKEDDKCIYFNVIPFIPFTHRLLKMELILHPTPSERC